MVLLNNLYPKLFNNIIVSWIDKYSYLTCFMKIPFNLSLALNQWKINMISEPSKYLLFIVGLYQRSVPLLLHGFQCCFYLEYIPIWNMVYC